MKIRSLLGTWLLLAFAGTAQALGLGEIIVHSRLNQPLNAEIVVREAFAGEAEDLKVSLASAEDFARVGIERAWVPAILSFEIETDARGRKVVRVTSQDPIREPNMTLLVVANWGEGRLLREYGVLLDPVVSPQPRQLTRPVVPPTPAAPPVSQQATTTLPPPSTPAPEPELTAEPVETQPVSPPPTGFATPTQRSQPTIPAPATTASPEPTPAPAPSEPAASTVASDGTHTVAKGDTLWGIANQLAPELGVSTNQLMVALQRNNSSAFFSDNINALKAGAVLRVPDVAQIRALTSVDARSEVARQIDAWGSRRSASTLADPGGAPASSASSAQAATSAPARVELLSPRSDDVEGSTSAGGTGRKSGGADVAEVQSDLKLAREELSSREQEVAELTSRVRDLEDLNSQNQRLLDLKNAEVAALQRRLAEATGEPAPADQPVAQATTTDAPETPAAAEVEAPAEPGTDNAIATAAEATAQAADTATPAAGADAPSTAEEPASATGGDTPAADEQVGAGDDAADTITDAGMEEPIAADSQQSEDEWEAAATNSAADPFAGEDGGASAPPATTTTAPAAATAVATTPAASTTPAPAPAQSQPFYMNPLAQGGLLLALALLLGLVLLARRRGKGEAREAEAPPAGKRSVSDLFAPTAAATAAATTEIDETSGLPQDEAEIAELIAHVKANPENHDSYVELLSIFYANNDSDRFAHWAQQLRPRVSADSAEWQAVADMGREVLPNNPLFTGDSVATPFDTAVTALSDAISPDIGGDNPETSVSDPWLQDDDVLDLGEAETVNAGVPVEELPVEAEPEFEPAPSFEPLEFSLDDDLAPVRSDSPEVAPVAADADDFPALDIDGLADTVEPAAPAARRAVEVQRGDDVATKLELARAYLDMGDPDGARAMLEEVLGEGDSAQRDQAARLLDSL